MPEIRKVLKKAAATAFAVAAMLLCALPGQAAGDVLGTVEIDASELSVQLAGSSGCVVGELAADAVRMAMGADLAIVNSGDLHILRSGPLQEAALERLFPEDRELAVATVTAPQLKALLEHSLSHIVLGENEATDREASHFDGFAQISGFSAVCDISSMVGARVNSITIAGQEIDLTDDGLTFTLAATGEMLAGGYGYDALPDARAAGVTLRAAFADYVRTKGSVTKPDDSGRLKLIGALDNQIISHVPIAYVIVAMLVFAAVAVVKMRRRDADDYAIDHRSNYVDDDEP